MGKRGGRKGGIPTKVKNSGESGMQENEVYRLKSGI